MTQCHLRPLFCCRFLVVLHHLLIFSTLPRTLPFTTSSWPYVCCRRILLEFKSSLDQGNRCTWRRLLSWRISWRVTSRWLRGCQYVSLLGSFGKLFCISLFLRSLIILVFFFFFSWPLSSSSLTSFSSLVIVSWTVESVIVVFVLNRWLFLLFLRCSLRKVNWK